MKANVRTLLKAAHTVVAALARREMDAEAVAVEELLHQALKDSPDAGDDPPKAKPRKGRRRDRERSVLTAGEAQARAWKALVSVRLTYQFLRELQAGLEHHDCPTGTPATSCTRCMLAEIPGDWLSVLWRVETDLQNEVAEPVDEATTATVLRVLDGNYRRLLSKPRSQAGKPEASTVLTRVESQAIAQQVLVGLKMAHDGLVSLESGLEDHACTAGQTCDCCALGTLPPKWTRKLDRMGQLVAGSVVGKLNEDVYELVRKHAAELIGGKEGEPTPPASPTEGAESHLLPLKG